MRHLIWQPRVMKQRIEGSQNKSQLNKRAANYFQLLRVMKQPLIALITRDGGGGGGEGGGGGGGSGPLRLIFGHFHHYAEEPSLTCCNFPACINVGKRVGRDVTGAYPQSEK